MEQDKKKNRKKWLLLLLLLLLIGFIAYLIWGRGDNNPDLRTNTLDSLEQMRAVEDSIKRAQAIADSLYAEQMKLDSLRDEQNRFDSTQRADSLKNAQKVADSLTRERERLDSLDRVRKDSLAREKKRLDSLQNAKRIQDSLAREKAKSDSLKNAQHIADSIERANDPCIGDTIIPWVYPKPSGGLHPKPVKVSFVSTEKCKIEWKFEGESSFRVYDGKPFIVSKNCVLLYSAVDPCGNEFSQKRKRYEIAADNSSKCPDGMAYIPSGNFCIDKYEWPNKQGRRPLSNVSFSQASDSCFTAGKRLCEAKEWESCCRGPYNWDFPYGPNYLSRACVTEYKAKKNSGTAGECRGWYDVYDMVGNLAEWTATGSSQKAGFYIVKGGFWDSGIRSSCNLSRHSYFPQNPHNPVGFRCCKDVDE